MDWRIRGRGSEAASTLEAWIKAQRTILDFWSGIQTSGFLQEGSPVSPLVYAGLAVQATAADRMLQKNFLAETDIPSQNGYAMGRGIKLLRWVGALLLQFVIGVIGTAVLTVPLSHFFHPRTIQAVLIREYLLSIFIACLLGFLVSGRWKAGSAKWVWGIGLAIFFARSLSLAIGPPSEGSVWFQMSGAACIAGRRPMGCINWFDFTVPAVRSVFYSVGAWLSWHFRPSDHGEALLDALLVRFRQPSFPRSIENSEKK